MSELTRPDRSCFHFRLRPPGRTSARWAKNSLRLGCTWVLAFVWLFAATSLHVPGGEPICLAASGAAAESHPGPNGKSQGLPGDSRPVKPPKFVYTQVPSQIAQNLVGAHLPQDPVAKGSVPIIYSTDLFHPHDDPDDHFDLATLFALEEFDIRAIILDIGRRQKERPGRVAVEQLLHLTGKQVPVAIGLAEPLRGPEDDGRQQPAEFQAAAELLLQLLRQSAEKLTIFTTGSLRDVAAAYLRDPELFRAKVGRLYVNIGDALGGPEHNVNLDPWAYRIVMRSDLPVYWCPCFSGGLWKREHGLGTYWRFRHGDVLTGVPLALQNFFLYALRHESAPALAYLNIRHAEENYRWLYGLERNMWCTAPFLHAAGRTIIEIEPGRFVAVPGGEKLAKEAPAEPPEGTYPRRVTAFRFRMQYVGETPEGQFAIIPAQKDPPPSAKKMACFEIVESSRYDAIMTSVLAELFRQFPLRLPQ